MSLFVGNLSKNVTYDDLRDVFDPYGPCKVQRKTGFAFIKYDNETDAEKALKHEKGKDMGGLNINIEWSKSSTKFDPNDSNRPPPRKRKEAGRDVECYNCRRKGHYARECTRRRSRSPRRDRRRDDRSRSRSDSRRRRDRYKDRKDRRRSRSDNRRERDDSRSDYKNRRDRRDKYMDRRRKRRDSRDDVSRSTSRYNKKHDREDYRGGSGGRGGDRNGMERPYSQERPVNDDADYSKNEPDIIRNNEGDYEKNAMDDDQQQEVQIGVDSNPNVINATENKYDQQKDSFIENPAQNQMNDPVGAEGQQMNDNQGNPETSNNFQEDAQKMEGKEDEMKEQAE